MKKVHTSALLLTALATLILSGCHHEDEKAGYPQYPPTGKISKPAATSKTTEKAKHPYKPAVKPIPGPAGELAGRFCALSVAANFDALAKLFNTEFMARMAMPQDSSTGIQDKQIPEMAAQAAKAIAADIKTSRIKPVEDCEIINTETYKCDTAVLIAMDRYLEKTNANTLKYALKKTNTTQCGFIGIREISNTGIEEARFFIGNPGGSWRLLAKVTQE